ncbi:hypothetical protein PENTCL1PPCAC_12673, partial [Pristionchus entomophagus]
KTGKVITHETMRTCSLAQINSPPNGQQRNIADIYNIHFSDDAKRTLLYTSFRDQSPFCRLKSLNEK